MGRRSRYSPEVRENADRLELEHARDHDSQWAAILSIAAKIGCMNINAQAAAGASRRCGGHRGMRSLRVSVNLSRISCL